MYMLLAIVATVILLSVAGSHYLNRRIVVEFGLLERHPAGGDILAKATRKIPFIPDSSTSSFGLLFYARSRRHFRAKVIHVLPAKPVHIGGDFEGSSLLPDGRFRIDGKELEYEWGGVRRLQLSAGDPLGTYELQLYVNGSFHRSIQYEVVPIAS